MCIVINYFVTFTCNIFVCYVDVYLTKYEDTWFMVLGNICRSASSKFTYMSAVNEY
jgi:hypothetical protein